MPDYQIDVGVEPDASRFPEKLAAAVGKAEARQDPIGVEIEPKVGREFAREAERKTKAALASLDAQLTISPQLSKKFRREIETLAKEQLRGAEVEVPVQAVLGRGFRRDLQRTVKEATAGAAIEVPVQAKLGPGFRAKLQRTVREALTAKPIEANVELHVDRRSFPAFVTEVRERSATATEAASKSGASDVRLGIDATGLDAAVLAGVGAATVAAAGTDAASVEVRADTKALGPQLEADLLAVTTAVSATEAASIEVRADTKPALAQIAGLKASADGAAGSGSKLAGAAKGGAIALAGVAVAAGAAGYGLFKVGQSFDDAFDLIVTKTGATGKTLAGLEQSFRNVAAVVPSDFGDIALAIAGVNQRLGLTGKAAEGVSGQILNLSRITGTDLSANLENAAGALQSFRVPADQIPGALDALFRASQASGVGVDALGASLKSSGAALRVAGFSFEESTALIAQLSKAGVPAEQVLGSLSIAARKLAKEGKDPAKSIALLVTEIKNAKSPTEALSKAQAIFGRGAVGITDAIRSGKFELADFLGTVQDGGATIEKTSAKTADAAESFQLLKNNLKLALEVPAASFFGQIGDVVKGMVPELKLLGPILASLVGSFGAIASGLLKALVPILKALAPSLALIGAAIGKTFEKLGPALAPIAKAFGKILVAIAPILPVLGDAAGKILIGLVPAFEALADPELVDAIVEIVKALADLLVMVTPLIPALVKLVVPVARFAAKLLAVKPVLYTVVAALVAYEIATGAATLATTLFAAAGEGLALNPIGLAVAAVVALGVGVFQAYKHIKPFREAVQATGRFLVRLGEGAVSVGKAVGRWVVGAFEDVRPILERVLPIVKTLFGIFVKIQLGPILKLGEALKALFSGDFSGFAHKLVDAFLVIPRALGDLGKLLGPALLKVGEWIVTEGVPLLAEKALALVGALVGWVADVGPKLLLKLGELLLSLGEWILTTAIPTVAEKAAGIAVAFLGWLAEAIVTLPLKLAEFGLNLVAWIIGVPIWLAVEVAKLIPAFLSWIGQTVVKLPGELWKIGTAVFDWLGETERSLGEKALGLVTSFLGFAWDLARKLPGELWKVTVKLVEWLGSLPGKIIEAIPKIVTAAAAIGSSLIDAIGKGISGLGHFVGDVASKLWHGLRDFINKHVIDPVKNFHVKIDPPGPGVLYDGKPFGSLPELAEGGLIKTPMLALVGEAGPELVLPLSDRKRMLQLLAEAGVLSDLGSALPAVPGGPSGPVVGAAAAGASGTPGEVDQGTLALKGSTEELEKWLDDSVALLAAAGKRISDASMPGLVGWREAVSTIFSELTSRARTFVASSIAEAQHGADSTAAAWARGLSSLPPLAAQASAAAVAGMAAGLSAGTGKVSTITAGYARALATSLNPILAAVGSPKLKLARGGLVPGPNVERDVIPALLMPGEVVIRKASVEKFGLDQLLAINRQGQLPGYRDGGQVTGDTIGLQPAFLSRLGMWSAAVGEPYHSESGYRSIAEQIPLYRKYLAGLGPPAAIPGTSMHNFGLAADGNHWRNRRPDLFGLTFPMSYEPWHVQPVEAKAWRAMIRDGGAGAAGIMAGLKPLPDLPTMPNKGAISATALAALGFTREKALAWAGSQQLGAPGGSAALGSFPVNVQRILATIRSIESGGNYSAQNPTSSAFGAYQFLSGTYASLAARFGLNASDHSPAAQDAIAGRYVSELLGRYGDDLRAIPASWYVGSYHPDHLNYVPGGGNTLSVADYIARWMAKYGSLPGFRDGGLVNAEGLHLAAARHGSPQLSTMTRGGGPTVGGPSGGRSLTIQGDVKLEVRPPGSDDPEAYGMALSHRVVPLLSAVLSRLG